MNIQGKLIEIDMVSNSSTKEKKNIEKMCEDVLSNSLTEKYKIKFLKNK